MSEVNKALAAIEAAMNTHSEQRFEGDMMSLTRAWREILVGLYNKGESFGKASERYMWEMGRTERTRR